MRRPNPCKLSLLVVFLVGCSSSSADGTPPASADAGATMDASRGDGGSMDASAPDGEPAEASAPVSDAEPGDDASPDATDAAATESGDGEAGDADAATVDGGDEGGDAGPIVGCEWGGAPGQCILVSSCDALADHTPFAGQCPGPDDIQCCITTPSTADNPPIPAGYEPMEQSEVTPDMTAWAVDILDDPSGYPMFSTATMAFGALTVLARVEWHPPDFQNSAVHRGVTLYQPG